MKPNTKKEKQSMIEDIMACSQIRPQSDTWKSTSKDLLKLRHFTLFTLKECMQKRTKR